MLRACCIALITLSAMQAEAKTKQICYGVEAYEGKTMDALSAFGMVTLEKTKVRDVLEVSGQLKAERSEFGALRVKGHAVLEDCVVRKKSSVQGLLEATRCHFHDTLKLCSERIVFDSCAVTSLTITEGGKEQVVELKGDTKVTGTIKFESGHGIVLKDATAEFTGELVGGVLKS